MWWFAFVWFSDHLLWLCLSFIDASHWFILFSRAGSSGFELYSPFLCPIYLMTYQNQNRRFRKRSKKCLALHHVYGKFISYTLFSVAMMWSLSLEWDLASLWHTGCQCSSLSTSSAGGHPGPCLKFTKSHRSCTALSKWSSLNWFNCICILIVEWSIINIYYHSFPIPAFQYCWPPNVFKSFHPQSWPQLSRNSEFELWLLKRGGWL